MNKLVIRTASGDNIYVEYSGTPEEYVNELYSSTSNMILDDYFANIGDTRMLLISSVESVTLLSEREASLLGFFDTLLGEK